MKLQSILSPRAFEELKTKCGGRLIYVPKGNKITSENVLKKRTEGRTISEIARELDRTPRRILQILQHAKATVRGRK